MLKERDKCIIILSHSKSTISLETQRKRYILKMCIVFFYTHSNYKIHIKAYLLEIISQGDIVKVTNGTSVQPNLVITKNSLFRI